MKPLNIFDATGSARTGWHTTVKLNDDAISQLADRNAKTSNALNAVPSPFSRLHIFDTALKLVTRDRRSGSDMTSQVYKDLVSDCLDALELVFNAAFHESQGDKLEFVNWRSSDLNELRVGREGRQIFAKTLALFLEQDFHALEHQISIIKYKGLAIAGSSPFSILFTSPNLDKVNGEYRNQYYENTFDLINPGTRSPYFKKYVPFSKRSESFKAHLAHFFNSSPELKDSFRSLWNYLDVEGIRSVTSSRKVSTKALPCKNGGVVEVGGIALHSNADETALEIFNDVIIKVGFRVNEKNFVSPGFRHYESDRPFDFLIPLKESFLKHCNLKELSKSLEYEILGPGTVKAIYTDPDTKIKKSKTYSAVKSKETGLIIDLTADMQYAFTLGLFPNLKVHKQDNTPENKYNDFYKVLLAVDAGRQNVLKTDNFNLSFYRIDKGELNEISSDGALYSAKRNVRRSFEAPDEICSIYYEINNSHFDFIKLRLQKTADLAEVTAIVVPKWNERLVGDKQVDFSVDFGTTNTFVAYTDDIHHTTLPKAFDISLEDQQMVMLQRSADIRGGQSTTSSFTRGITNEIVNGVIINEFVPPVILPTEPNSPFKMPFRTAVFQKKNIIDYGLFHDINIHFAYQKHLLDSNSEMYQEVIPNIKWEITNKDDIGSKKRVDRFIRELCYLFRYKTLLSGGDPSKSVINWFIPQSLSEAAREDYKSLWKDNAEKIFKTNRPTKMVLEAEAPYYFLKRTGAIQSPNSVLSIDIGGGSTDAMLFMNDIPRIGTSFNFAGNVLWGNGYNQFTTEAKENGFYNKLKDRLAAEISKSESLNQSKKDYEKRSTDEIINFWLSNSEELSILELLKDSDFKIVYLVHYTAIIYHLAQLLKSSRFSAPNCLIFSGNGSKYIDFLGREELLSKVTGYIFSQVFAQQCSNPQIILPSINRKEATCFGGIFKQKDEAFISKTYLGLPSSEQNLENLINYNDLENNIVLVKNSIKDNVLEMFKVIEGLNDVIPFRSNFGIDINIGAIMNFLKSRIESDFDKGYGIRKQKVSPEERVSDSLFFYPLIGAIFELGRIDESSLENFLPTRLAYVAEPADENLFCNKTFQENKAFSSVYEISIPLTNSSEATFTIIDDAEVHRRAFNSREHILNPVCQRINQPESSIINIRTLNKGRLRKDGDNWVVTEKLKIEFI